MSQRSIDELEAELASTQHLLRMSQAAQSSLSKRAQALRDDWPQLFRRYFTNDGDADRADHRPTRSNQKPRKRKSK